jgi:hypothetical protein
LRRELRSIDAGPELEDHGRLKRGGRSVGEEQRREERGEKREEGRGKRDREMRQER